MPLFRVEPLSLIVGCLLLFSCKKQEQGLHSSDFLSLDKTIARLDTTANSSDVVTVKSSILWTAVVSSDAAGWLQIDKTSGGRGNTVVKVSSNGGATARSGTVTFRPANGYLYEPVVLTVTQQAFNFSIGYSKLFGGSQEESSRSINTPDGGIIMVGFTMSTDGDVHGSHGKQDAWIVKLNSVGDTVWTRTLGGTGDDVASGICNTPDGGYMVTGSTDSEDGDITDKRAYFNQDMWVFKLDGNGKMLWSKTFGGFGSEYGGSIITTADGGYIVSGATTSTNADVTGDHGGKDVWVLKLDKQGNRQWAKAYGGSAWDEASRIVAVPDGYVLAGLTNSSDGDVTGYHVPEFIGADFLVLKIDLNGNKLWAKAFGGTADEVATSLVATPDGYVVGGYTSSNNGDVTGNKHGSVITFNDMWVIKVDKSGGLVWSKTFGGTFGEYCTAMAATPDGGFILTGSAESKDGDVVGKLNDNNDDLWLVKLDAAGNKQWTKILGGSGDDVGYSVMVNPDGYTITGSTTSMDGDVRGTNHGGYDLWAVKILVQ